MFCVVVVIFVILFFFFFFFFSGAGGSVCMFVYCEMVSVMACVLCC